MHSVNTFVVFVSYTLNDYTYNINTLWQGSIAVKSMQQL